MCDSSKVVWAELRKPILTIERLIFVFSKGRIPGAELDFIGTPMQTGTVATMATKGCLETGTEGKKSILKRLPTWP